MITTTQMYWITRADAIYTTLTGFMVPLIILTVLATIVKIISIFVGADDDDDVQLIKSVTKFWVGFCVALGLIAGVRMFVPTTKELAAIIVVPKIANSTLVTEKIPQELAELYAIAKQYMVETLKEKAAENTKVLKR